jgi:hypothetical protein
MVSIVRCWMPHVATALPWHVAAGLAAALAVPLRGMVPQSGIGRDCIPAFLECTKHFGALARRAELVPRSGMDGCFAPVN